MTKTKKELIDYFFQIRGNEQLKKLYLCKSECERFLLSNQDQEISYLIQVINALATYFETSNKEKARKYTINLWYDLYNKDELSLFEIRMLNCILFTELRIEKVTENVEDFLIQLENYQFHKDYTKIKIALNSNLIELLMDARLFDPKYKNEFEAIIDQKIEEVIDLNLNSGFNSKYFVGLANIYQGILLKDKKQFYTGLLLLESSDKENNYSVQDLISFYTKKYQIVVS